MSARPLVSEWPVRALGWLVAWAAVITALSLSDAPASAATAAALLTVTLLFARSIVGRPMPVLRPAVARRSLLVRLCGVGVPRSCDPDAAGHARPRAPGA